MSSAFSSILGFISPFRAAARAKESAAFGGGESEPEPEAEPEPKRVEPDSQPEAEQITRTPRGTTEIDVAEAAREPFAAAGAPGQPAHLAPSASQPVFGMASTPFAPRVPAAVSSATVAPSSWNDAIPSTSPTARRSISGGFAALARRAGDALGGASPSLGKEHPPASVAPEDAANRNLGGHGHGHGAFKAAAEPTTLDYDFLFRYYQETAGRSLRAGATRVAGAELPRERSPSLPLGAAAGEMGPFATAAATAATAAGGGLGFGGANGVPRLSTFGGLSPVRFGATGLPGGATSVSDFSHRGAEGAAAAGSGMLVGAHDAVASAGGLSEGLWRGVAQRREAWRNEGVGRSSFLSPARASLRDRATREAEVELEAQRRQEEALSRSLVASFASPALAASSRGVGPGPADSVFDVGRRTGSLYPMGAGGSSVPGAARASGPPRRRRPLYLGPGTSGSSRLLAERRRQRLLIESARNRDSSSAAAAAPAASPLMGDSTVAESTGHGEATGQRRSALDAPLGEAIAKRRRVDLVDVPHVPLSTPASRLATASTPTSSQVRSPQVPKASSATSTPVPRAAVEGIPTAATPAKVVSDERAARPAPVTPSRTATADAVLSILRSGPALPTPPSRPTNGAVGKELVNPYEAQAGARTTTGAGGAAADNGRGLSARRRALEKMKEEERERRRRERERIAAEAADKEERASKKAAASSAKRARGAEQVGGAESALELIERTAPSSTSAISTAAARRTPSKSRALGERPADPLAAAANEEGEKGGGATTKKASRSALAAGPTQSGATSTSPTPVADRPASAADSRAGKGAVDSSTRDKAAFASATTKKASTAEAPPRFSFGAPPAAAPSASHSAAPPPSVTTATSTSTTTAPAPALSAGLAAPSPLLAAAKSFAPKKPSPLSRGSFGVATSATPPGSPGGSSTGEASPSALRRDADPADVGSRGSTAARGDTGGRGVDDEREEGEVARHRDDDEDKENAHVHTSPTPATSVAPPAVATQAAATSTPDTTQGADRAAKPLFSFLANSSAGTSPTPPTRATTKREASSARERVAAEAESSLPTFTFSVTTAVLSGGAGVAGQASAEAKKAVEAEPEAKLPMFEFGTPAGSVASNVANGPPDVSSSSSALASTMGQGTETGAVRGQTGSSGPTADEGGDTTTATASAGAASVTDVGPAEGEEGEETVHAARAKLWRLDGGAWADLGVGSVKLQRSLGEEDGGDGGAKKPAARRFLVRSEGNGKVTVNFRLYESLTVRRDKNVLTFLGFDSEGKPASFRCKLKEADAAEELRAAMEREAKALSSTSSS